MSDNTDKIAAEIAAERRRKQAEDEARKKRQKDARDKAKAAQEKRAKEAAAEAEAATKRQDTPGQKEYKDLYGRRKESRPQQEAGRQAKASAAQKKLEQDGAREAYERALQFRSQAIDSLRNASEADAAALEQNLRNRQSDVELAAAKWEKAFGTKPANVAVPSVTRTPSSYATGTVPSTFNARNVNRGAVAGLRDGMPVAPTGSTTGATGVAPTSGVADPALVKLYMSMNPGVTLAQATAAVQAVTPAPTAGTGGSGGGGPKNTVMTQRTSTTYTQQQVEGFARSVAQNALGRDLSDEEWKNLTRSVNAAERKSPTVTRTATNYSGSSTNQKISTKGGMDEQQFVQNKLEQGDEFSAYQKATTYFDAMISSLRGPVGGGI